MQVGDKVRVNDSYPVNSGYLGQTGVIDRASDEEFDWFVEFDSARYSGEDFYESELDLIECSECHQQQHKMDCSQR